MNYIPELIGVGKYTGELALWLAKQGHEVEVVTAWPHYPGFLRQDRNASVYSRARSDGVMVFRCPLLLRNNGRGIWRLVAPLSFALAAAPVVLWRALRRQPDVVVCVEPTLMAAPAAVLAARLTGAKLALHVQDLEVDAAFATRQLRGRSLRAVACGIERILLRQFERVVTISDAMASRLAAKGVADDRLTVVRNWLALPAENDNSATSIRRDFGIGADEKLVLYAGHLGLKQGVPLLADALQRLTARRTVRIVVVGDGPMAGVMARASEQIPGLLHLPLMPRDRYEALMQAADVHVLPQDATAADLVFPSKLGPMLATGRPVVVTASASTELSSWLDGAAVVVPTGDPEALAHGIEAAFDDTSPARAVKALALARSLRAEVLLPVFEASLLRLLELDAATQAMWPIAFDPVSADPQHA